MSKLSLVVAAQARSQLRWAKQHLFHWAILTPIVLAGTYAIVSRVASNIGPLRPSVLAAAVVAVLVETLIIAIALSRACAELYHIRLPESGFEAMPLETSDHLHLTVITRLARTAVTGTVLISLGSLFGEHRIGFVALPRVAAFTAVTAVAETWAALGWIHWQHKREWGPAALLFFLLLITVGLFGGPLVLLLMAPRFVPQWAGVGLMAGGIVWAGLMYALLRTAHRHWRAVDVEHARRIHPARRRSRLYGWLAGPDLHFQTGNPQFANSNRHRSVRAQLARDLMLTLRVFSTGVYAAAGIAALAMTGLAVALTTGGLPAAEIKGGPLDATWLPGAMAAKIACVIATASLSSLVHVLIAHEGARFWLERAVGTTGHQLWLAKLWYARIVSGASPLLAWLIVAPFEQVPGFYLAPLLAECAFLWWLVSSLIGGLAFETPGSPGTSLLLMAGVGLALGLAAAFVWPFGLLIYGYAMHGLTDRGRTTARYYLLRGED